MGFKGYDNLSQPDILKPLQLKLIQCKHLYIPTYQRIQFFFGQLPKLAFF